MQALTHRKISCENKVFAASQMKLHDKTFISNAQMAFSGWNFVVLIWQNIFIDRLGICVISNIG